jgi:hypothetical protein
MSQSNNYFKSFVNNYKFTFVVSIASILGLALGLITLFPPQKRPFYSIKSFNLIDDSSSNIDNLDIKYKVCDDNLSKESCQLEEIKSLTVTKILFWNGGRTKIDKTDIDDNPITIVASGKNSILDGETLHISNDKTDFKFDREANTIHFDFLDSGDGGVLQIIHTGLSNEDIILDGYVEESRFNGKIKLVEINGQKVELIDIIFFLIATIFFLLYLCLLYIDYRRNRSFSALPFLILYLLLYLLWFAFVGFPRLYQSTWKYPANSYEVFNSEITTK